MDRKINVDIFDVINECLKVKKMGGFPRVNTFE